jgi:hypothetical protein
MILTNSVPDNDFVCVTWSSMKMIQYSCKYVAYMFRVVRIKAVNVNLLAYSFCLPLVSLKLIKYVIL